MTSLFKSTSALIAVNIIGSGLAYLSHIYIARMLGLDGFGHYSFVLSVISILVLASQIGVDNLFIRMVPKLTASGDSGLLRGILLTGIISVFFIGSALAAITYYSYTYFFHDVEKALIESLAIGMAIVPFLAIMFTYQAIFTGDSRAIMSRTITEIIKPVIFIGLLVLFAGLGVLSSAASAMALNLLSIIVIIVISLVIFLKSKTWEGKSLGFFKRDTMLLSSVSLPLFFFFIFQQTLIQLDTVMLGTISGTDVSGAYWAAARLATMVALPLYAVNTIIAPRISAAFSAGKSLQEIYRSAILLALPMCIAVYLVFVFFGEYFLWLFGNDFLQMQPELLVIGAGYIIAALMGPVDYILTMTKHEKYCAKMAVLFAAVNIAMNLVLIPIYGSMGAAISTAVSVVLLKSTLAFGVVKFGLLPASLLFKVKFNR